MGRDIFFVSITLDPEHDKPEKLATFAEGFNVTKGWTFLTGSRENIDIIRSKLGERAPRSPVIGPAGGGEYPGDLTEALHGFVGPSGAQHRVAARHQGRHVGIAAVQACCTKHHERPFRERIAAGRVAPLLLESGDHLHGVGDRFGGFGRRVFAQDKALQATRMQVKLKEAYIAHLEKKALLSPPEQVALLRDEVEALKKQVICHPETIRLSQNLREAAKRSEELEEQLEERGLQVLYST
jgi:hypothetical protein